jgi:hypothetical protein
MKVAIAKFEYDEIRELLLEIQRARLRYKNCRRELAKKYNLKRKTIKVYVEEPFLEAEHREADSPIVYLIKE